MTCKMFSTTKNLAESDYDDDDHSDDFTTPRELDSEQEEGEVLARSSETLKALNFNFHSSDIAKVNLHPNGKIKSIEFKSAASTPLKKEKGKRHLGNVIGKSYWQFLKAKLVYMKKRFEINVNTPQGRLARNLLRRRLITSIRSLVEKKIGTFKKLLSRSG